MPASFTLEIVTPERKLYEGDVIALSAPGIDGLFGVLYNRAPVISALGPGPIVFRQLDGGERRLAIAGGFFEVHQNRAVILADKADFAEEIDPQAAAAELEQARQRLTGIIESDAELERRREALKVAQTRVRVASQVRR